MSPHARLVSAAADALAAHTEAAPALVGFDGFLDEIIHVVRERHGVDAYTRMDSMAEFGWRVQDAAGLSCSIELLPQRVKLGGNGPILANALRRLGHETTYVGALGKGTIHPVFDRFAEDCARVVSLTDPAWTHAVEFHDGKVMLSKMGTLDQVTFAALEARLPGDELLETTRRQGFFGFVNWTMLPHMNGLLEGFHALFARRDDRPEVFIDLADPRKRSHEDIRAMLGLLGTMQTRANLVLGLNRNESRQIGDLLGARAENLAERAAFVRDAVGISAVVIHPTTGAACATEDGAWEIPGPYTDAPRLTTGAGDVFNSGFCHARLAGLPPEQCLVAGVCASGHYVRVAHSATEPELIEFMRRWAAADCGAI